MPKLTFPTIAEQVLAEFTSTTKTVALVTLAKRKGAEVARDWPRITYTFDDDTSIVTIGRGKNHRAETLLP